MKFRRCHILAVMPVEKVDFSVHQVFAGGAGLNVRRQLQVLAAHLDQPCVVDEEQCLFLFSCSPGIWQDMPGQEAQQVLVQSLLALGLLFLEDTAMGQAWEADARLREVPWWPLAAIHHRHARWHDVDSALEMRRNQMVTADDLVRKLGKPPLEALPRQHNAYRLHTVEDDPAALALSRRTTCRNFDPARPLSLALVSLLLQQVLMAQGQVETEPGVRFLKKNVPSAGGLHPVEAYLVVQNVEGLTAGLYHYHAVSHELAATTSQPDDIAQFALQLLAGQDWFATAPVLVVLTCRFGRNFWKYRNHTKAYRAVCLDAGHVSQALYTAATEQGLGAFVTAAINEHEIETLLGTDPMQQGALAVSGFGWRADTLVTPEFDPLGRSRQTQVTASTRGGGPGRLAEQHAMHAATDALP